MFTRVLLALGALIVVGVGLAACTAKAPPAPKNGASMLPDTFFVAEKPDARPLLEVKKSANKGEEVVFEARIGGRVDPFVANRSVFLVVDPSLKSCDELHGDSCPNPWDYCCETPDSLVAHTATVQFKDVGGKVFPFSVKDSRGLSGLKTVRVKGMVAETDGDTFVVDVSGIWVAQ